MLGQVNRPGRYPIEMADMRLTDLLANAGGVTATAPSSSCSPACNGKPYRVEVELAAIFAPTAVTWTSPFQNGDVLWVDRAPWSTSTAKCSALAPCAWSAA